MFHNPPRPPLAYDRCRWYFGHLDTIYASLASGLSFLSARATIIYYYFVAGVELSLSLQARYF